MAREQILASMAVSLADQRRAVATDKSQRLRLDQTVVVYLREEGPEGKIQIALDEFAEAVGWKVAEKSDPIHGSWFRRFRIQAADGVTSATAREMTNALLGAANLATDHARANVDDIKTTAATRLIDSLKDASEAVALISSILAVKLAEKLIVIDLSEGQLAFLERQPHLLIGDPLVLLLSLSEGTEDGVLRHIGSGQERGIGDPNSPMIDPPEPDGNET